MSCGENDKPDINDGSPSSDTLGIYKYIIAGDTSFNVDYYCFIPPIRLSPIGEPFYIWDSVDLDKDQTYDFKFFIAGTSNDVTGYGFGASILSINNSNEIAFSWQNDFPDVFDLNDTISDNLNWICCESGILTSQFNDGELEGNWTDQENKFLATRLINQDTLYCWMRMDIEFWGDFVIYDYGIMKK